MVHAPVSMMQQCLNRLKRRTAKCSIQCEAPRDVLVDGESCSEAAGESLAAFLPLCRDTDGRTLADYRIRRDRWGVCALGVRC